MDIRTVAASAASPSYGPRPPPDDDAASQAGGQQDAEVTGGDRCRVAGIFQKQNEVLDDCADGADSQRRAEQDEPEWSGSNGLRYAGRCDGGRCKFLFG